MTTALRTKPAPAASASFNPTNTQDHDMTIITNDDLRDPLIDPLAPDSPDGPDEPPGLIVERDDTDIDESLDARAPVARCADGNGTMTGLFFSDHVVDIARAKAMCALCPLAAQCLADAIEREEPWGVWGGELISGGRIVANKRPCGRPPKNPRPDVVYDEMGPVGFDLTA